MDEPSVGRSRHVVLRAPGVLDVVDLVLPVLDPAWARVRFAYCGVCGTDVSHYTGRRVVDHPVSLGHEWVAVVEDVGTAVDALAPGDVVVSDLNFRCGTCDRCLAGTSHLCRDGQVGRFTNRGFGTRADIDASYLTRCSSPVSPELALAEPLSCVRHAWQWARPSASDRVLLIGAGGMGMCLAFLMARAEPVVAFDLTDERPARLDALAALVGPLGHAQPSPTSGYDVVFDASGTESGLRLAVEQVAPGGRLCLISHLPDGTAATFLLDQLTHKDVTFTVSYLNGERSNVEAAVAAIEQHWDERWSTLLDVRSVDELGEVLDGRADSPAVKTVLALPGSLAGTDRGDPVVEVGG